MWFVVGCFGLAARWLEKAQLQCLQASVARADLASPATICWMLRNRGSLLLWLWCVLQPVCLVSSGWTQWTTSITGISNFQTFSIAMFIAPSAILLMLIEGIRVSHSSRNRKIDASISQKLALFGDEIGTTIAATWFIPVSLPLMIAAITDLVALAIGFLPYQELLGVVVSAIAPAAIGTFLIPHLFTRVIRASPVDESIAVLVERTWRIGSNRVPCILHWPTGCLMANAAVVGIFTFGRKLLLTDALLQRLNDKELAMVVLHELSHCIRYHSLIRVFPTLLTVVMLFGAMTHLTGAWLSASCFSLLIFFIASLITVCWWTEFDADRMAIELAVGSNDDESQTRLKGASELIQALRKIYGTRNFRRSSWMHPSCEIRIGAIERRLQSTD